MSAFRAVNSASFVPCKQVSLLESPLKSKLLLAPSSKFDYVISISINHPLLLSLAGNVQDILISKDKTLVNAIIPLSQLRVQVARFQCTTIDITKWFHDVFMPNMISFLRASPSALKFNNIFGVCLVPTDNLFRQVKLMRNLRQICDSCLPANSHMLQEEVGYGVLNIASFEDTNSPPFIIDGLKTIVTYVQSINHLEIRRSNGELMASATIPPRPVLSDISSIAKKLALI